MMASTSELVTASDEELMIIIITTIVSINKASYDGMGLRDPDEKRIDARISVRKLITL